MDAVAQFFRSTTGWSVVFAFVGGVGVFLPWDVPVSPKIGIAHGYGGAISSSFLLVLLYLLATSALQPIPA